MKNTRCQCGAITVERDGQTYSMSRADFLRLCPGEDVPRKTMHNCNWCVNHWGIGLCGCGSGKKFGKCREDLTECARPAQDMDAGVACCTTDNGWGTTGANHRSPFGPGV